MNKLPEHDDSADKRRAEPLTPAHEPSAARPAASRQQPLAGPVGQAPLTAQRKQIEAELARKPQHAGPMQDWTNAVFRPDLYQQPVMQKNASSEGLSSPQAAVVQAKGVAINDDPALEREADELGAKAARGEPAAAVPGAAVQAKADASIQAKTVEVINVHRLADQIHSAISGLGTDESAVFSALSALRHQKSNIDELKQVYQSKFGVSLVEDIQGDFSGSELAYALSLLQPNAAAGGEAAAGAGTGGDASKAGAGSGAGAAVPAAAVPAVNYDELAATIHNAIAGMGTDEEAVYTTLAKLDGDSAKLTQLKDTYKTKYGVTLQSDVMGDFSGDELKHVLELLGERSNTEKVNVANDEEAKRAAEIIREIYVQYGIDVNSQAGMDAIYKDYDEVPEEIRNKLKTTAWEYKELVALKKALDHFAPILGEKRKDGTRAGADQEIRTVSKVDQAIDQNSDEGQLDTTTLGEYFEASKNFSMFTAGTNSTVDFPDNNKQLEGTAIHEIAHGLMKYALDDYVSTLAYWEDRYTKSAKAAEAEAPITDYGSTNAGEDLSEAVMYYFVEPNTLKNGQSGKAKGEIGNPCPERFAFIEKAVKDWKIEPKTGGT